MKERPILFNTPMVRAILDGRKTQTRRVIRQIEGHNNCGLYNFLYENADGYVFKDNKFKTIPFKCPFGKPVDRLWVREKHSHSLWMSECGHGVVKDVWYWSDGDWEKPRPSIHMPRWASRITLEITSVRVERLQDISEKDARAEGVESLLVPPDDGSMPYYEGFKKLWESIKGHTPWDENPWVWVVEFRKIEE